MSIETKVYADGTVVTGVAPLPTLSPSEQALDDLLDRCEALARRAWLLNEGEPLDDLNGTAFNLKGDIKEFRARLSIARSKS